MIVDRYNFNQKQIDWIPVISGNTLLYPVSVRDCPGPKRGVFCILILDLISRSALVLLILLCASNYRYNKGPLKVEFIKCRTIHSGLLSNIFLQEISLQWVIKSVFTYINVRYTYGVYLLLLSIDLQFFFFIVMFCIILLWTIAFLTDIESVLLWHFWTQMLEAVKKIHKL